MEEGQQILLVISGLVAAKGAPVAQRHPTLATHVPRVIHVLMGWGGGGVCLANDHGTPIELWVILNMNNYSLTNIPSVAETKQLNKL